MTAFTIVPPYLLQRLAEFTADEELCRYGRSTLAVDELIRAHRSTVGGVSAPAAATTSRWSVHTARGSEQLPGDEVRPEGAAPVGDAAVDEAYDGIAATWDLFSTVFGRQSVDGQGRSVLGTVHYGQDYDNAFWNGDQLVFGDGDGRVFGRFTKCVDVLGHEFTHGVTEYTTPLTYSGQSGALNESISDVFGSMVKQRVLGQDAADADWLIGAGLFLPGVNGVGLRSMKAPGTAYDDPRLGKDPQPASMSGYQVTTDDNGGVHLNSGIPNHAFYLSAVAIGGPTWEGAGRIWWSALTGGALPTDLDFAGFAQQTIDAATRLSGAGSAEVAAVRDAWTQVKVLGASASVTASRRQTDQSVYVRRTGGFAGIVREGHVDLATDPQGPEVASLLGATELRTMATSAPHPDQFVYTLRTADQEVTISERDLTPDLARVVRLVLGDDH